MPLVIRPAHPRVPDFDLEHRTGPADQCPPLPVEGGDVMKRFPDHIWAPKIMMARHERHPSGVTRRTITRRTRSFIVSWGTDTPRLETRIIYSIFLVYKIFGFTAVLRLTSHNRLMVLDFDVVLVAVCHGEEFTPICRRLWYSVSNV